nr:MAG TPA: hypothetical protein [Podoviridae sp. ctY3D12]
MVQITYEPQATFNPAKSIVQILRDRKIFLCSITRKLFFP